MTQLRIALPLLALASLSACIVPVPVPPGTPGSIVISEGDSCGARGLRDFVGQSASAVEGTSFQSPGPVRVVRPGDAVAADVDPTRVNFRTDAAGMVVAVDCG